MFPLKIFTIHSWEYLSREFIYSIVIWITWFQLEIATPQFQIPNMNFKKEKIHFQQFFLYFEFGNCILLNWGLAISKKESLYFQMMAMNLLVPFRTIRVWNYFTKTIERNLKLRNVLNCKVYCARCLHTTMVVIAGERAKNIKTGGLKKC